MGEVGGGAIDIKVRTIAVLRGGERHQSENKCVDCTGHYGT